MTYIYTSYLITHNPQVNLKKHQIPDPQITSIAQKWSACNMLNIREDPPLKITFLNKIKVLLSLHIAYTATFPPSRRSYSTRVEDRWTPRGCLKSSVCDLNPLPSLTSLFCVINVLATHGFIKGAEAQSPYWVMKIKSKKLELFRIFQQLFQFAMIF